MSKSEPPILKFPCDFPLKVMGRADADFDALVVDIVRRHVDALSEDAVQGRPSRQGNYRAVTVTIQAQSQTQLDALYRELTAHTRILMVL
jgi:uncharacterized protein